MEREINTDARGNEVWAHRHMCVSECVFEEVAMSAVWKTVEKEGRYKRVTYACVCHPRFFLPTLLPLEL